MARGGGEGERIRVVRLHVHGHGLLLIGVRQFSGNQGLNGARERT